ncbi:MAG TPA: hypothetical protein VMR43_05130 [Variovorax sp.]|nr:hypothetical protein [Variovorax sp.]
MPAFDALPVPAPFTTPMSAVARSQGIESPGAADPSSAMPAEDDAPVAQSTANAREPVGAPFVKAKFEGLVLVCGQCEKRSSGPSKLTAKDARKSLKGALGAQRTGMRIVESSCLGLCPKKSIAIAAASRNMASVLAEVRNESDLKAVAVRLADPRRDA